MKALTLHQPWASLVVIGAKTDETRGWPCPPAQIGKPLAIHAGAVLDRKASLWGERVVLEALEAARLIPSGATGEILRAVAAGKLPPMRLLGAFPRKKVVAVARVVASALLVPLVGDGWIREPASAASVLNYLCGDFSHGRYAWRLADVKPLPEPCPVNGMQQLWDWTWGDGIVEQQLGAGAAR